MQTELVSAQPSRKVTRLSSSRGGRRLERLTPHQPLVLHHQVVRQDLDVLGRVLDLVPASLCAWTELLESIRPAAGRDERFEVSDEDLVLWLARCHLAVYFWIL